MEVPNSESHAPGFTTSERAEIPPSKHGVWRTPVADHLYPKFAAGSLTQAVSVSQIEPFFEGLVIGNQQLNCEKYQQSTLFKGIWSVLYFSDMISTHIWAHKHTKTTCRYIKTQIDKNWRILTRLKNVIASVHEEPFGKSTPYLSWIELQNSRKMPSTGDVHLFFNNNLQDMLSQHDCPLDTSS